MTSTQSATEAVERPRRIRVSLTSFVILLTAVALAALGQVMLKHGWIEERPDEEDQRSARLKITPKGRKLLESIAPAWKRV